MGEKANSDGMNVWLLDKDERYGLFGVHPGHDSLGKQRHVAKHMHPDKFRASNPVDSVGNTWSEIALDYLRTLFDGIERLKWCQEKWEEDSLRFIQEEAQGKKIMWQEISPEAQVGIVHSLGLDALIANSSYLRYGTYREGPAYDEDGNKGTAYSFDPYKN